jgi:excisionase family DNA binding protein
MIAETPFLRARDIAPLLGVSSQRVAQLLRAGRIPAVREGRSVLVPRPAWEAWIRQRSDDAMRNLDQMKSLDASRVQIAEDG